MEHLYPPNRQGQTPPIINSWLCHWPRLLHKIQIM